jgi:hypothetical protein
MPLNLRLCLCAFALLVSASAEAADPWADSLAAARQALIQRETKAANAQLAAAEAAAPGLGAVVLPRELARIWFYRGVSAWLDGDTRGRSMDAWRMSLVVDPSFEWDEEVMRDDTAQNLYEALRSEVRDRKQIDARVPEKTGAAQIFIDGNRKRFGETAAVGKHLGQIKCPDEQVYGLWTDLEKDPKWFKLCPAGVDTTVVVAEAPVDEFGDMGPAFGPEPGEAPADPGLATAVDPAGDPSLAGGGGEGGPVAVRRKIYWPLVGAAGALGLAAGGMHLVAAKNADSYSALDNDELQSAADLEELRGKVNRQEGVAVTLAGLSAGVYVAAFIQW